MQYLRRVRATLLVVVLFAAAFALACRSAAPPPTPTPSATAGPPSGFPAQSLREVDWASAAVLDEVRRHFGSGEIEPRRVAYADLTGDGNEEALVVVESGGTAGDLGAAVYRLGSGRASILAWIDRAGHIELETNAARNLSLIRVQQGIYAPGDANCCPSRIREIRLRWNGVEFLSVTDQVLPAQP